MDNRETAVKQQVHNMQDVMSQALYGDNKTKVTSEEIVNMGDAKIQEVMESRIFIEPYPLDEWTYMLS